MSVRDYIRPVLTILFAIAFALVFVYSVVYLFTSGTTVQTSEISDMSRRCDRQAHVVCWRAGDGISCLPYVEVTNVESICP